MRFLCQNLFCRQTYFVKDVLYERAQPVVTHIQHGSSLSFHHFVNVANIEVYFIRLINEKNDRIIIPKLLDSCSTGYKLDTNQQ